jgi:hypothetical protein
MRQTELMLGGVAFAAVALMASCRSRHLNTFFLHFQLSLVHQYCVTMPHVPAAWLHVSSCITQ